MRAAEMVERLAEWFGVPHETAAVMDRSLADANLRTKGRGRAPQNMALEDALALALVLTARPPQPTRAAELAAPLLASTAQKVFPAEGTSKEDGTSNEEGTSNEDGTPKKDGTSNEEAEALLAQPIAAVEAGNTTLPSLLRTIFAAGAPCPDVWIEWEDRGPLNVLIENPETGKACRVEMASTYETGPHYDGTRKYLVNTRRLRAHFG